MKRINKQIKETGAVNYFWNFLKEYFNENTIIRHQHFEIDADGVRKYVHPDFYINGGPEKVLFEFKELKESQQKNTPRDILIRHFERRSVNRPNGSFIPDFVDRYLASSLRESADQLKPARNLQCPSVLVVYSAFRGIEFCLGLMDNFAATMYKDTESLSNQKTPMNTYPYISALAHFSILSSASVYSIRFYHNRFADFQFPYTPFNDRRCQHFIINNDLSWTPQLSNE